MPSWPDVWGLPLLLVSSLVIGELRGGAPTHHPGRALLSVWLLAAIWGTLQLVQACAEARRRTQFLVFSLSAISVGLAQELALVPEGFAQRKDEEAVGRLVRREVPLTQPIVLATSDYGYLAVQAAAGGPDRFLIADRHDPRDLASDLPPEQRALDLARRHRAEFLVAPKAWDLPHFQVHAARGSLALFQAASLPQRP